MPAKKKETIAKKNTSAKKSTIRKKNVSTRGKKMPIEKKDVTTADIKKIKAKPLLKEPRHKTTKPVSISKKQFTTDILREARVLGLHRGSAEIIAERVYNEVRAWLDARGAVTKTDLNREIAKKIKKYHADLSYLYENRGKII